MVEKSSNGQFFSSRVCIPLGRPSPSRLWLRKMCWHAVGRRYWRCMLDRCYSHREEILKRGKSVWIERGEYRMSVGKSEWRNEVLIFAGANTTISATHIKVRQVNEHCHEPTTVVVRYRHWQFQPSHLQTRLARDASPNPTRQFRPNPHLRETAMDPELWDHSKGIARGKRL